MMKGLKGFDKFRAKVPYLSGRKIVFLPIFALILISLVLSELSAIYSLPGILSSYGINEILLALLPAIGLLTIEIIGFALVFQMWRLRDRFKAKYGPNSYSRALPLGLLGVFHIFMLSFNQFIPYYRFSPSFWSSSTLSILATPLYSLMGPWAYSVSVITTALSLLLLLFAFVMIIRALLTFGFDYMTLVYLYFPEESSMQNHKIYSVMRHPTYGAALLINLAGMFFTFTIFSVLFFALLLSGFWLHVHFVEERELIERFGESYRQYRSKVPAFFVYPHKFIELISILAGR